MSRSEYDVFLGLEVGAEEHHACGLSPDGERLHDKPLPHSEAKIRAVFEAQSARGRILVVVDQPTSTGALAVTVARDLGIDVAYLPRLAMRRIADLHPGNAKANARDAYVIAEAARSMPHALRRLDTGDEALADLEVIVGYDDLAGEVTRVSNRIRGLLTQIHPALERVLGPKVSTRPSSKLLTRYGGPQGLAASPGASSSPSPSHTPHAPTTSSSTRSSRRGPNKPSPSPAPAPPNWSRRNSPPPSKDS